MSFTRTESPVDLFTLMQHLALEIAGRTMFSLEMKRHGLELRDFVLRYSGTLSQPHMLDVLLPTGIPTPWDIGRRWFRRQWIRFVEKLIRERAASGEKVDGPRDLFDLLVTARDPETGKAFSPEQVGFAHSSMRSGFLSSSLVPLPKQQVLRDWWK